MQRLRRLLARRSVRRLDGAFVVEGATLLRAALDAGAEVESCYLAPGADADPAVAAAADAARAVGARVFTLADGVLERVADTVTPQPVLAVVRQPAVDGGLLEHAGFAVVCVEVRDPGNLGTVVRSAAAAGADVVVCTASTVDPFNPKTVRASAGAVLSVPLVVDLDAADALRRLRAAGVRTVGAVAHGGRPHTEVDWTVPVALVLGNEAAGLRPEAAAALDATATIALASGVESLNVSMAATVLCFEVARQRNNLHPMHAASPATGRHTGSPGGAPPLGDRSSAGDPAPLGDRS